MNIMQAVIEGQWYQLRIITVLLYRDSITEYLVWSFIGILKKACLIV